jgi:hypothetical protein
MTYGSTSSRHQHPRFATVAKIQAVRADYMAGMSYADLMQRYGVSEGAITFWRRKYGWPPRVPSRAAPSDGSVSFRWRCDCGQLNQHPRCTTCGHIPMWATKDDAA